MSQSIEPEYALLLKRPIDSDTKILRTAFFRIDQIPLLIERWSGDGVTGSTAVFLADTVGAMDDAALKLWFMEKASIALEDSGVTIVRRVEFTFLNFGFQVK